MKLLGKSAGFAVVAAILAIPALAQDMRSASQNVVACQDVDDPMERLECYESTTAILSSFLAAPVQEAAGAPQATAVTVPVTPIQQAAAPSTSQAEQALVAASASVDAPIQQASADRASGPDAPKSRLPSWIPRVTFGSNNDADKEPDEFATKMTRIQANRIGRHFFTTAEGQVWKQTIPGEIRAPKQLPADVILSQNIMGGLMLKIVETNRSYSVQRVE